MDAVNLVDNVPQQVTRSHAVIDALENRGDHVATIIAVRTRQAPKIGEETIALSSVWPDRFVLIDKGKKFVPCDSVRLSCPVPPTIRIFNRWPELAAGRAEELY